MQLAKYTIHNHCFFITRVTTLSLKQPIYWGKLPAAPHTNIWLHCACACVCLIVYIKSSNMFILKVLICRMMLKKLCKKPSTKKLFLMFCLQWRMPEPFCKDYRQSCTVPAGQLESSNFACALFSLPDQWLWSLIWKQDSVCTCAQIYILRNW